MVDAKVALATLGWRVNSTTRLKRAIEDFQTGWNLGPALSIDGYAGPKTAAALDLSVRRRAEGKPDFSENFSAVEFRCKCSPVAYDCRRIWITRSTVRAAEKYRTLVGSFTPVRACRCPTYNKAVGGVSNSQHLYGRALDVPVYNVTVTQARNLGVATAIGTYTLRNGRRAPRHIDTRAGATVANPIVYSYGSFTGTPLTPKPITATTTAPTPKPAPTTTAQEPTMVLIKVDGHDEVYLSTGSTRRHITPASALEDWQRALRDQGATGKVTILDSIADLDNFGRLEVQDS